MKSLNGKPKVYIVSDSVGETAELVTKAAASQFDLSQIELRRIPYVEDVATINEVISMAKDSEAVIVFTLVVPELREYLLTEAKKAHVKAIDIMGPMIDGLQVLFRDPPRFRPGMVHQLDEDYFRKVEAIEFAVKYDDGRDPRGLLRADVILIGVSRTSKTPLSMYLAHKRVKAANVPLVPEVAPPEELFKVDPERCVGLTITPEKLIEIRSERLKSLGLEVQANYAKLERIKAELAYAQQVMERIGCQVIDVSNKAVEETANIILEKLRKP
ncbi:regulator of PEP synthase PpsR (kinase-PPPase family) [Caldalkalibacillus uzonensis]|uniref:Putative pyruvate, phosphate dikinase regulatory protein n=1 Tax=Caldalkalibacillus uzonensis TaxID=353224 RepID=A0ABU0CTB1_9BACI|nr:pyruvate, water dikinase regulatory protein [Caldalkalibacillus uzonensis]MDQ0339651.1 regulator of PEP synthase PpsR (kinase-PPPase family) [Caldalkalibacillus uzonensis]